MQVVDVEYGLKLQKHFDGWPSSVISNNNNKLNNFYYDDEEDIIYIKKVKVRRRIVACEAFLTIITSVVMTCSI